MVVTDRSGAVLQRDVGAGLRIPVDLSQVTPVLIQATISAEDQRFEHHPGVDPIAILRALAQWPAHPGGASTITQQLARKLYLGTNGPVLVRKAREALLALQLEARRSKDDILALYLNELYYGRGAYGIEAAARVYFGTSARSLDLAQASMLAGLPRMPGVYDPVAHPAATRQRQAYVLDRLVADGQVSRDQADAAAAEPLEFASHTSAIAPHFLAYAQSELARLRPDLVDTPGLVVETTLDAGLQREVERIVRHRLNEIRDKGAGNAAVVVLEPQSGAILAMVGGADFFDEANGGQINMALQPRQPGSALKPFLYAAAFERGFTPATPLLDIPSTFATPSGLYSPRNYDRRYHGLVPVRVALASSFNVPAVRTTEMIGVDSLLEMLHRVGLATLTNTETYGLALALGGGEVRLLDLTAAYGAIATGGIRVEPMVITRVRNTAGRVLYTRSAEAASAGGGRVLSAELAYLLADILSDPAARIPGFGEADPLRTSARTAFKTGTTTDSRDNWTMGFTPDRVAGVWVGNTDSQPMENVSGVDGAGPIWRDVIETALRDFTPRWFERPGGLVESPVCAPTGLLPGPECLHPVNEVFVAGTEPQVMESYYLLEDAGQLVVNPPTQARPWAQDAGLRVRASFESTQTEDVSVVQPVSGSVFFLAPELSEQHLMLRAAVPSSTSWVEFRIDGQLVLQTANSDPGTVWRLEPGVHEFQVIAFLANGTRAMDRAVYEVRGP